jgi:ArsR family metal-binding transcriptional regulator
VRLKELRRLFPEIKYNEKNEKLTIEEQYEVWVKLQNNIAKRIQTAFFATLTAEDLNE